MTMAREEFMMIPMESLRIPHLGGIDVAYHMPELYSNSKPTLILVHGFTMDTSVFTTHFQSQILKKSMNLLGIDVLGHGNSKCPNETFTYCDTAMMIVQLMNALGIEKAFLLGNSQGGCIIARTYLVAPQRIQGIVPIGALMDGETESAHSLGCFNAITGFEALIDSCTSLTPTPDFEIDDTYCNLVIDVDFGDDCSAEMRTFWQKAMKSRYKGDKGRKDIRMAAINLRDRDGLHGKLEYGTMDAIYPLASAGKEIKLFKNSPDASLVIIKDGVHALSDSHQDDVENAVVSFVSKYHKD